MAKSHQSKLRIVPCSSEQAKSYVERFHRHHGSSVKAKFSVAVADEVGTIRGVALVGRPVARVLDDGATLEVNRVATDGCENACSALYGASRRIAKEMGYERLITYIRQDEPGVSLVASGWVFEQNIRARSWNMPGRPRIDKTEVVKRARWSIELNLELPPLVWPVTLDATPSLFDGDE